MTSTAIGMARTPLASAIGTLLLLSACQSEPDQMSIDTDTGTVAMSVPAQLLNTRAIDRTRLRAVVRVDGGSDIPIERADNGRWQGTIRVEPGSQHQIDVEWIEEIPTGEQSRDLVLARYSDSITVDAEGGTFSVDAARYTTGMDDDQDGVSNLQERTDNTNPFGDNNADAPFEDGPAALQPTIDVNAPVVTPPQTPVTEPELSPTTPVTSPAADASPEPDADDNPDPVTADLVLPVDADEPLLPPVDEEPEAGGEDGDNDGEGSDAADGEDGDNSDDGSEAEDESGDGEDGNDSEDDGEESQSEENDDEIIDGPSVPQADADIIIPRIAAGDAPNINGRGVSRNADGVWSGEWLVATHLDAAGNPLLIDRLMIDNEGDESNGEQARFWAAAHDGEYLYIAVLVDDAGQRVRDSDAVWRDDSLELYLDGDNSKSQTYGADDFARLFPLSEPFRPSRGVDEGIVNGFLSSQVELDIDFETGPRRGPASVIDADERQDIYELRVGLESAGIVPGRPFGLELQINDDDDGGLRDAKWGWAHPARVDENVDETYRNPSYMGTALLE